MRKYVNRFLEKLAKLGKKRQKTKSADKTLICIQLLQHLEIHQVWCGHGLSFSSAAIVTAGAHHASVFQLETHTQAYTHIQCIHCSLFSILDGSFKWLHWTQRKEHSMPWGSDVLWVLYCQYLCIVCMCVLSVYCMRVAAYSTVEAVCVLQCTIQWMLAKGCRPQWRWC